MSYLTFKQLDEMQKWPLAQKIQYSTEVLKDVFETCNNVAIAFSGGKDSTVLWHMIRTFFPAEQPHIIFGNTGVEYPESLAFARELGKKWGGEKFHEATPERTQRDGLKYAAQQEVLQWLIASKKIADVLKKDGKLRTTEALEDAATAEMWADFRRRGLVWPAGTLKSYWWCCDQYGFPLLGKAASKLDARRINIDCFLRFSESDSNDEKLKDYYDMLKNVKISQHCCMELKKKPSDRLCKELGVDCVIMGMMASESRRRMIGFCENGPFYEVKKDWSDGKHFHAHPMGIWTDDDVWDYIREQNCPYSPLYDIGYEQIGKDGQVEYIKIKRNGCMGCGTDLQFKNNHLSTLRRTHPKQWKAIMKYGTAEQIKCLRQYRKGGQICMLDCSSAEEVLNMHPCIFDRIDTLNLSDDTFSEYDEMVEINSDGK